MRLQRMQYVMASLGVLLLFAASSSAQSLYAVTNGRELLELDLSTGAGTQVATIASTCSSGITEIEVDSDTGRAFAQGSDGSFCGIEFDLRNGSDLSGSVPNGASFNGIEIVNGVWYGTYITGPGGPSTLATLNPFLGTSTGIGLTGVGPISGLAYDGATMYGIAGGPGPADLYTIDLNTGVATVVGTTTMQAGSLELGPDGKLYAGGTGPDAGNLFQIDPVTAASTLVGATGFGPITGLALVDIALDYHLVALCRLFDTRQPGGPTMGAPLADGTTTGFAVQGNCNVPVGARAVDINLTAVTPTTQGHLRVFPSDVPLPNISTVNYAAGQTIANGVTVPLADQGIAPLDLSIFARVSGGGTVHAIVDVVGYLK